MQHLVTFDSPGDLAEWFEHEPAPYWGERQTYLHEKQLESRRIHVSELSLDALFSVPHYDVEELDCFDVTAFAELH